MLRPPLVKQIKFANKEVEVFLQIVKTKLGQEISMFLNLTPSSRSRMTQPAIEDFNEFEVGYEVYEGGSYWEPSTTDYAEHSKHKTLELALLAMLSLWVGMSYRNFQESQWAEESVAELDVELDWSLD